MWGHRPAWQIKWLSLCLCGFTSHPKPRNPPCDHTNLLGRFSRNRLHMGRSQEGSDFFGGGRVGTSLHPYSSPSPCQKPRSLGEQFRRNGSDLLPTKRVILRQETQVARVPSEHPCFRGTNQTQHVASDSFPGPCCCRKGVFLGGRQAPLIWMPLGQEVFLPSLGPQKTRTFRCGLHDFRRGRPWPEWFSHGNPKYQFFGASHLFYKAPPRQSQPPKCKSAPSKV